MKKNMLIFLFLVITIFSFPKVNALTPDQIIGRTECPLIELGEAKTDGSLVKVECYDDYNTAKDIMNKTDNDNLVIVENGMIMI